MSAVLEMRFPHERASERNDAETLRVLETLLRSGARMSHRVTLARTQMHRGDHLTGGRRRVLRDLARHGPRTVPQMARARECSRQHIQMLVNPLVNEGYVELIDNPAHRRSRLVRLTPRGADVVRAMIEREERVIGALPLGVDAADLRAATQVLEAIRRAVSGPAWHRLVASERRALIS